MSGKAAIGLLVPLLVAVLVVGGCSGAEVDEYFATPTATPTLTAVPTVTPTPTTGIVVTPPASSVPPASSPPAGVHVERACARVVHHAIGEFLSYIAFELWLTGEAEAVVFLVRGANDDEPLALVYDPLTMSWSGDLGLHEPGIKTIESIEAVVGGLGFDLTDELLDYFGMDAFDVRYPEEDSWGACD